MVENHGGVLIYLKNVEGAAKEMRNLDQYLNCEGPDCTGVEAVFLLNSCSACLNINILNIGTDRVCIVCRCICICWTYYCSVNPYNVPFSRQLW